MLRSHNHRNRDYLRSDRAAKRNRRRMTFRLGLVIFIFVFLAVGMLIVTRIDAFAVKDISVEGNREVTSSELIDIAQVHASSSWLYFFPRKSIVLYPTKELEADIKAKFPRFSDVAINRSGLSSIRIRVIERSPRALWCDDVQSSCYTVDDQGYIYARADDSFATTSELIRFVGGNSSSTSSVIGTNINSSSTFSDIVSLLQGMKDRGLTPEQVEIRNNHEFSVKVHPGGSVIFSDIHPFNESLGNLSAALESAAFKAASSSKDFEYIDTRFGNKIFFKLK